MEASMRVAILSAAAVFVVLAPDAFAQCLSEEFLNRMNHL
jgi:hypothetical protein